MTTIVPTTVPHLAITKSHVGDFHQGDTADTYTITVSNAGTGPTDGSLVTVTDTLPAGLSPTAADSGTINGWSVTNNAQADTVTATRSRRARRRRQLPGADGDGGRGRQRPGERDQHGNGLRRRIDTRHHHRRDERSCRPCRRLAITKSHVGDFHQGDAADTYTITVSNAGTGPTDGSLVTATDTLPTGLSPTAADSGTINGWSVTNNAQADTITATRSDVLAAGNSYPALTVTVAVAGNAPASVTNSVTASGGGSPPVTATDPTTILPTGLSSLSGYVYDDAAENGVYVRGNPNPLDNDFGLPNVTVSVYLNGSATPVQVTTTGSDGLYDFEGLAPGTYQIAGNATR